MDDNLAKYLIVVVAISAALIAWVLNTWIRARHGIPSDEELALLAVQQSREGDRNVPLLIAQNERLIEQVSKLEERLAVLERIATDPSERTAREIEKLR
jgi:hypothetical protein